jgi:hypothetical protein
MSGPSPPSPMPPLPPSENPVPGLTPQTSYNEITPPMHANHAPNHHQAQVPPQHVTIPENSSPPIPQRNNIRNRLELDSVSPAVQRPNPMDAPVSPITPSSPSNKANFSYPSRAPPQGVPRQVPVQPQTGNQQPTPQQWGEAWNTQQHTGYDNESSRPIPFRVGHTPQQQPPQGVPQKQPTLANLKAAAHGIHVSSTNELLRHIKLMILTGSWGSSTWNLQQHRRSSFRCTRLSRTREEPGHYRRWPIRNRVAELRIPTSTPSSRCASSAADSWKAAIYGPFDIRFTNRERRKRRRQTERVHEEDERRPHGFEQRRGGGKQ